MNLKDLYEKLRAYDIARKQLSSIDGGLADPPVFDRERVVRKWKRERTLLRKVIREIGGMYAGDSGELSVEVAKWVSELELGEI